MSHLSAVPYTGNATVGYYSKQVTHLLYCPTLEKKKKVYPMTAFMTFMTAWPRARYTKSDSWALQAGSLVSQQFPSMNLASGRSQWNGEAEERKDRSLKWLRSLRRYNRLQLQDCTVGKFCAVPLQAYTTLDCGGRRRPKKLRLSPLVLLRALLMLV